MKKKIFDTVCFSRARDFYLYTSDGTRYLDMHLNEAQALLGHKMAGFGTVVKQVLDKAVLSDLVQKWLIRCERSINKCFNVFPHGDTSDKWVLGGWYYVFFKGFDTLRNNTCIPILRPYGGLCFSDAVKNYTQICYVIPRVWSPMLVPLLYKEAEKQMPEDVYTGIDEITKRKATLVKVDKISALDSVSCYYAFCALIKSGLINRIYPAQVKNRKDIFGIKLQTTSYKDDEKNTNRVVCRNKKHIKIIELELLPQWERHGIYIVLPFMDHKKYKKIQEICFFYHIFVPDQEIPWVIPPYFTKQELQNWGKALSEIKHINLVDE